MDPRERPDHADLTREWSAKRPPPPERTDSDGHDRANASHPSVPAQAESAPAESAPAIDRPVALHRRP
ncbi:hypothetical protein GW15_0219540 [Xanthomonas axonopodis pv. vasculorum]|uniref:Uncharacterized protein n=1 Tax=Xanthomonas axonopodis pv. vasculorum TaxID=325777 RepID=A0A098PUA1_9XANT|nr:hypothetical protein GW15_0219540 [Xanthomonas axonopodis pv. vasculorum]PPV10570.1 hypothetical protein XavaCFBP5823_07445 [Xanthomonas axonopodis pv. vasculorum]